MVALEEDVTYNRRQKDGISKKWEDSLEEELKILYCTIYCIVLSSYKDCMNQIQYIQDYQKVGF